jgi:hypothetical protein
MARGLQDPKGYYRELGVRPNADASAIKAAYRARAKELHPDRNPSADAAEAFARLTEAYEVLGDPRQRTAYDLRATSRGHPAGGPFTANRTDAEATARAGAAYRAQQARADAQAGQQTRTQSRPQPEPPPQAPNGPRPAPGAPPLRPCQRCGKVTAQPRHIILRKVTGLLRRSLVERIEGIYCRRCAQATAVRASYASWLRGWWSLPHGPADTLRALIVNLRGGELPAEENRALLVEQARAFLARRELDLARGCAEQAMTFVRTGLDRREVETLLGLIPRTRRRLRDRWQGVGWSAPVQLLPLLAIGAVGSLVMPRLGDLPALPALFSSSPAVEDSIVTRPEVLGPELGKLNIAAERLTVRTGPSAAYRVAATLTEGTPVLVTEMSPDGAWARITTSNGLVGFTNAAGLRPRTEEDAIIR